MAKRVLPRQESQAGRVANRHAESMGKFHSGTRQFVEVGSGVGLSPVTPKDLLAYVIRKNEKNIGNLLPAPTNGRQNRQNEQKCRCANFHPPSLTGILSPSRTGDRNFPGGEVAARCHVLVKFICHEKRGILIPFEG